MVNKQIVEQITEARDVLNRVEQIGELAYNVCDGMLHNLKTFIHDDEIWKLINEKEKTVRVTFQKKIEDARSKLTDYDPLFAWKGGVGFYMELRSWECLEMLNFWDKLVKEHDL